MRALGNEEEDGSSRRGPYYHSNLARYPAWQAWLREHRPPTLLIWGRNDPIFLEAGAHAYLRDVPAAELHLLDTGHFALEEEGGRIAVLIAAFIERHRWYRSNDPRPRSNRRGQGILDQLLSIGQ